MFKIFYAEKDATLYENTPLMNTGVDEILEIGKRPKIATDGFVKSRSVLKFDLSEISNALQKYNVSVNDCKFMLQLYTTDANALPVNYEIEAKILADDWHNGTGFEASNPYVYDGVSWYRPTMDSFWTPSGDVTTKLAITGSFGGSWYYEKADPESGVYGTSLYGASTYLEPGLQGDSEIFSFRTSDLNMDVSNIVKLWFNGTDNTSIPNNGFLLKFSDTFETSSIETGYVRFFSRETHTIYVPRLTMYWDNSQFSTDLTALNTESYIIYPKLKSAYKDTEIAKIRFYGRDKFPQKTATNLFPVQTVKSLPETTYYSIIDAATDETIIPFDDIYTKVSCDNTSNYIHLDMNGLMPERYYRIALKIVDGFEEHYNDNEYYFKVVR